MQKRIPGYCLCMLLLLVGSHAFATEVECRVQDLDLRESGTLLVDEQAIRSGAPSPQILSMGGSDVILSVQGSTYVGEAFDYAHGDITAVAIQIKVKPNDVARSQLSVITQLRRVPSPIAIHLGLLYVSCELRD